jgi:hypothetical protein
MRLVHGVVCAVALALVVPTVAAQDQGEKDRAVAGGGITAAGWIARLDAASIKQGRALTDSKFAQQGADLVLNIGPAATYWNPKNVAKGDYTVKATIKNLKSNAGHPHSAGIFIGGQGMDSDATQAYTYCVAYTNGAAMIRQFNGTARATTIFGGNRPEHINTAVKPEGPDGATNEIAWTVKGGVATCSINGTVIGAVEAGKMPSTDGIYGIRVTHNVDMTISGFGLSK